MKQALVLASFDNLDSPDIRFLQEAAKVGPVHLLLLSDAAAEAVDGRAPKFPLAEREYFVGAIRYVDRVSVVDGPVEPDALPADYVAAGAAWFVRESDDTPGKRAFCEQRGLEYRVIPEAPLAEFPSPPAPLPASGARGEALDESPSPPAPLPASGARGEASPAAADSDRKKVIVTGCYDWFHSGHVRFFEEVAQLGDLYVVVGHDANIKLLKGEGHPMFSEDKRRYMAGSIRYVTRALVSSGDGWLDAEPEIERIRPDIYAVNEDGDRPEKREYCEAHGIEYRVLRRLPKEGLPTRQSTDLRGF